MRRWVLRFSKMIFWSSVAVALSSPVHAQRQLTSGEELVAWSQQAQGESTSAYSGFVLGVHDAFNEIMFCTSRDVGREMIEDTVSEFLKANPELLRKSGADLVRQALSETFPCG